ncbi:hypothetical protein ABK040_008721 [Willaertia magna]
MKNKFLHLWSADRVKEQLVRFGGAGVTEDEIKPLYERKFDGESLVMLAQYIEQGKREYALQCLESTGCSKHCENVLRWIEDKFYVKKSVVTTLRDLFEVSASCRISEAPKYKLVTSFGHDFIFQIDEHTVNIFSDSVQNLLEFALKTPHLDKQTCKTFFVASSPGTGKSRMSQELRQISINY